MSLRESADWARHASGQDRREDTAEGLAAHEDGGEGTAAHRTAGRRTALRHRGADPAAAPPPRAADMECQAPGTRPGTAYANPNIPVFPPALPGALAHIDHAQMAVQLDGTHSELLDVGPAAPYYDGPMAHGVPAPVRHGGRPAPPPADVPAMQATRHAAPGGLARPPSPIPVYITSKKDGARPLTRCSFRRMLIAPAGQFPTQIAGKNPRRRKLYVYAEPGSTPNGGATSLTSTTSPGASAQLATATGAAGVSYTVNWAVQLQGSPVAGTDDNNFYLNFGGTADIYAANPAIPGFYPQPPWIGALPGPNGSLAVSVRVARAATAGVIYSATLSVTPNGPAAAPAYLLNDPTDAAGGAGGAIIPTGSWRDFHDQDAVYAICGGATQCYVSVIDEYEVPNGA